MKFVGIVGFGWFFLSVFAWAGPTGVAYRYDRIAVGGALVKAVNSVKSKGSYLYDRDEAKAQLIAGFLKRVKGSKKPAASKFAAAILKEIDPQIEEEVVKTALYFVENYAISSEALYSLADPKFSAVSDYYKQYYGLDVRDVIVVTADMAKVVSVPALGLFPVLPQSTVRFAVKFKDEIGVINLHYVGLRYLVDAAFRAAFGTRRVIFLSKNFDGWKPQATAVVLVHETRHLLQYEENPELIVPEMLAKEQKALIAEMPKRVDEDYIRALNDGRFNVYVDRVAKLMAIDNPGYLEFDYKQAAAVHAKNLYAAMYKRYPICFLVLKKRRTSSQFNSCVKLKKCLLRM
jgi:hypothetical protein